MPRLKLPWARRERTPIVLQLEATECGAAALASILAYHGLRVPLEELRLACGVSRDGSRASNVVRAARHYGLTARAFRKEISQLPDMPLPAIIFWNFNHFVVLESFGAKGAWLNDPAFGHRFVPPDEFDESFTGVILTFAPGEDFEPGGERPSVIAALRSRLVDCRAALVFAVLAAAGLVVPSLAAPAYLSLFVDQVLIRQQQTWLTPLVGAMFVAGALSGTLALLQQYNLARFRAYLGFRQSMRFIWHVLRLPVSYFTQRHAVEVATRAGLNDRLAALLGGDLAVSLLNTGVVVIYAIVMFHYDRVLTAIGVGSALLNLIVLIVVSRRLVDLGRRRQMDSGLLGAATVQGFVMIDTLKATGTENLFLARRAGYHAKLLNASQTIARTEVLLGAVPMALGLITSVAIVVVGGQRVMDGALTIGALLGFQALLGLFSAPVHQLIDFGGELQEVRASLERLDDVLRQPVDRDFSAEPAPDAIPDRIVGTLRMSGIQFGYSPLDDPLIDDFSLELPPGARVALVGRSGSGKSTIGRLAVGLYRPWDGEITLGSHPLESIPRETLRHSVAYVDQGTALFPGTVRDNISLWDPTLPEERLFEAARDAMILDTITARPLGFDHPVAEGGRDFSGGQRQRMMIARALALDPLLLVLDEATNALDTETEAIIMENIRRRGCACIMIAHRLSTVRLCDEIIVMRQGMVVERGTHDSLFSQEGEYRSLLDS